MTVYDPHDPYRCAAPGCPRAIANGRLCPWHREILGRTLAQLRGDLTARAEPPSLSGWAVDRHRGGTLPSERDPINLRRLDAQRQAPPILAAWADWLCQLRPDIVRTSGGAAGDRELLARHLDWLCAQPEVRELWCQIRALWASLRGHLPIRRCTCGGPVWPDRGAGWCSWCSSSWSGRELLDLPRPDREVA